MTGRESPAPDQSSSQQKLSAGTYYGLNSKSIGLAKPINGVEHLADTIAGKLRKGFFRQISSNRSANFFDVIRGAVLEGISNAEIHRTWLAEIDRIAHNADSIETLRKAISAYLRQAGIERVEDFADESRFVVVPGREGDDCRVIQPAYIDGITKRTILAGRASSGNAKKAPWENAPSTRNRRDQKGDAR